MFYHFKFHDASHKVQVHGLHHTPEACSAEREKAFAKICCGCGKFWREIVSALSVKHASDQHCRMIFIYFFKFLVNNTMICLDCMQTITIFMKLNSFFFHAYSSFLIVLFGKL